MSHYEIETKSLLGTKERADGLVDKMFSLDPSTQKTGQHRQLTHYFVGGDIKYLCDKLEFLFSAQQNEKLKLLIEQGKDFSIRSRQKDNELLFIVKAALDDGGSVNGVSRLEFEEKVPVTSLAELDELITQAGFAYEAKWSRERTEYSYKDINVCLDKNAGYGYLAEFEIVTHERSALAEAKAKLLALMQELAVEELAAPRLDRMFAYYKQNWPDYYGTDKTFIIE